MNRKLIATLVIGISFAVLGSMALTPKISYGSPATDKAARDGADQGAAAGRAAAEAETPVEDDEDSGGSCGG